jgi:alkanesulfonate monooxygenase SsuD/methylene tetrahydromethanopterin reductase-like flavin-dependent oxidoreductase (luciferase family)
VSFAGVTQQPPPVQRPHPPIVVGGHSEAACRRAATMASGWYGVFLDVEEAGAALDRLRRVAARCERPAGLGELEITITPPGRIDLDTARRYADLGVHRLVLQPVTEDGSDMDELIDATAATLIGRS